MIYQAPAIKDNSRNRPVKNNSSKYTGVYYDKSISKWKAQIMVDKSVRSIGYYDTEEAAAIDYARAAFKYKPFSANSNIYGGLDLSNIPEQQSLITNANSKSGFKGVKKMRDKGKLVSYSMASTSLWVRLIFCLGGCGDICPRAAYGVSRGEKQNE